MSWHAQALSLASPTMKRTALAALTAAFAVVAALALAACPPKHDGEQLPPAGLAGGGAKEPLALPGAGLPVAAPSGTTTPQTQLPPGHPAIPGMASADADPL